jgi:hypothetical protein
MTGTISGSGTAYPFRAAAFTLNKFALKSKLYINAIRQAFDELQQLKSATA